MSIQDKVIYKPNAITIHNNPDFNPEIIDNVIKSTLSKPSSFDQIQTTNSKNVEIGNLIYIQGPVTLNYQEETIIETHETETYNTNIVPRQAWGAVDSKPEVTLLSEPIKLIVIGSTATEADTTFEGNCEILRVCQSFHMDSQNWSDISYNFMIGCDNRVYEGRGWKVQGAHSKFYNNSIGIWFIGTFITELPSLGALILCKELIKRGVMEGFIDPDYKLIGQCQCRPFESPGLPLYQEIQKWDHWTEEF